MKKFISFLVAVLIIFSLAGCSNGANTDGDQQAAKETTEDTKRNKVNIAVENQDDEPKQAMVGGGEEKAEETKSANMAETAFSEMGISPELDEAIGKAVIYQNDELYVDGECDAEGHIVLDFESDKSSVTAYVLTIYGEYGFQNDMFIKMSGTGPIPAIMKFTVDENDEYTLISYEQPDEAAEYASSVRVMFPKELYNRLVSVSEQDKRELQKRERKYAKEYLDKIGRSAEIGDYSDVERLIPDIPDDSYNMIFGRYWEYPSWIGTEEKIEDGIRYVYETQWKDYGNESGMVYFTKYVFDTGEIIRTVNVHVDEGEVKASEEKVLRLVENSKNQ